MNESFISIAKDILKSTKYRSIDSEINELARRIELIESRGLHTLIARLRAGCKKIIDTIAELNFAIELINYHDKTTSIEYEPDCGHTRPIDFCIKINNLTFWVQMKKFSRIAHENFIDRYTKGINDKLKKAEIPLFYSIDFSEYFLENDIESLAKEILLKARKVTEEIEFIYPPKGEPIARVKLWRSPNSDLKHLTLGMYGDYDFINETNLQTEQIKKSLEKAASAFKNPINDTTLNLIAVDASNVENIDIYDAVFGTAEDVITPTKLYYSRAKDGFFNESHSDLVTAIIVLREKESSLFSDFEKLLLVSKQHSNKIDIVKKLFCFDKIVY